MAKPILDPITSGEPKMMSRSTKGIPTSGDFNHLPPGMNIANQDMAMDLKRIASLEPVGPIILGTTRNRS